MPDVSATDLDIACNVYSVESVRPVQEWLAGELTAQRGAFAALCRDAQRGVAAAELCARADDLVEDLAGVLDVHDALVRRVVEQLQLCTAAVRAAVAASGTGASAGTRRDFEARQRALVRDVRAARTEVACELAAATLAQWLLHEGLFTAAVASAEEAGDGTAVIAPAAASLYVRWRAELADAHYRVFRALRGSTSLVHADVRRLAIDCFVDAYLTPRGAAALGTFPPPTLATFVDVFRAEGADLSPALVVLYYALLDIGDGALAARFRAAFPLSARMEQWTLAMWNVDRGAVALGIAALRRAGVLYDRVVLPLVRGAFVRDPGTELYQTLTVMCSTPATTPRTAADALVRMLVLLRAGMLDTAFAYYRDVFCAADSPLAPELRAAPPGIADRVLEAFFATALELGFTRLLVLLPLSDGETSALERHFLAHNMATAAAALQIAQGHPERVQQLARAHATDPVLATVAGNMRTGSDSAAPPRNTLAFSASLATMDTSCDVPSTAAATAAEAASTQSGSSNSSGGDAEMKDGDEDEDEDEDTVVAGPGSTTMLLAMKSPQRTPNKLTLPSVTRLHKEPDDAQTAML